MRRGGRRAFQFSPAAVLPVQLSLLEVLDPGEMDAEAQTPTPVSAFTEVDVQPKAGKGNVESISGADTAPTVGCLAQIWKAELDELTEALCTYGSGHPVVMDLRRRLGQAMIAADGRSGMAGRLVVADNPELVRMESDHD